MYFLTNNKYTDHSVSHRTQKTMPLPKPRSLTLASSMHIKTSLAALSFCVAIAKKNMPIQKQHNAIHISQGMYSTIDRILVIKRSINLAVPVTSMMSLPDYFASLKIYIYLTEYKFPLFVP